MKSRDNVTCKFVLILTRMEVFYHTRIPQNQGVLRRAVFVKLKQGGTEFGPWTGYNVKWSSCQQWWL